MDFQEAKEKASQYFLENRGIDKIGPTYNHPDYYIFYAKEEVEPIGDYGVMINKKTGELSLLTLPSDEGFKILDQATKISG